MLELSDGELAVRVLVTLALAGVIGIEREIAGQPAGFRTHVALALGSALFGLISIHAFDPFTAGADTNVRIDVTRVASQVAAGVGFIGAGAILKQGASIRGLTTAASLWTTAAIGLAVGVGYYAAGVAVTAALLVSLAGLRSVRRIIRRRLAGEEEEVTLRLLPGGDPGAVVGAIHALQGLEVRQLRVDQDPDTGTVMIVARVAGVPQAQLEGVVAGLADRDDIDEIWVTPSA